MTTCTCPRCQSTYERQRAHPSNPGNICDRCRWKERHKKRGLQRRIFRVLNDIPQLQSYGVCVICGEEDTHMITCPIAQLFNGLSQVMKLPARIRPTPTFYSLQVKPEAGLKQIPD